MYSKLYFTRKKILSFLLVCSLACFCFIVVIKSPITIIDGPTPLSGGPFEAMFYIENSDTGSFTCVGDGLVNTSSEVFGKTIVASAIITAPDYGDYLPKDLSVIWDSITYLYDHLCVIGTIGVTGEAEEAISDHTWVDTSQYDSSAQRIIDSISTAKTLYFSTSGKDSNSGLDPDHPKKNPTDYLRNGNCTLLLKSGDIFTLKYALTVGGNTKVSTYGGEQRAVINWVPINSSTFQVYDAANNIYYAPIDKLTSSHYKVAWLKIEDINSVDWQKVFSYNDLNRNMDFYSDTNQRILYVKSNTDLTGRSFAFASDAGGFVVQNSNRYLLENLEIIGAGLGINICNASDVVIRNCYVHHVGGVADYNSSNNSYFRYGNGIQIWATNTNNIYVHDNYVSDCFDAGITPQISGTGHKPSDSIYLYDNYVDRCLYNIEFFEHNRERNVPLTNVVVQNNILTNAMDITNGYRYATYGYTSYFCAWSSLCDETNFTISNNIGYGTKDYAFAFYEASPDDVNTIDDNTLVVMNKNDVSDCVKNYDLYSGTDEQIIPSSQLSTDIREIKAEIYNYTSNIDMDNLFFSYLDKYL